MLRASCFVLRASAGFRKGCSKAGRLRRRQQRSAAQSEPLSARSKHSRALSVVGESKRLHSKEDIKDHNKSEKSENVQHKSHKESKGKRRQRAHQRMRVRFSLSCGGGRGESAATAATRAAASLLLPMNERSCRSQRRCAAPATSAQLTWPLVLLYSLPCPVA